MQYADVTETNVVITAAQGDSVTQGPGVTLHVK